MPSPILLPLLTLALLPAPTTPLYPNQPLYKIRQIIDYQLSFSATSNATLLFTSCGAVLDLREAILSFLYYNTYPLRVLILIDRCSTPEIDLRSALPQKSDEKENGRWFRVVSFGGSELEAWQKGFELVQTKYLINYANKWISFDDIGFVQQAIDSIQHGQRNKIKISQVTTLFPVWKNYRSLTHYTRTPSGTTFYQIRSFKPTQRYHFTLNPSVINFDVVFRQILHSNVTEFAALHRCQGNNARDCFQLELGKALHDGNGYIQAFVDDGSTNAKIFLVQR